MDYSFGRFARGLVGVDDHEITSGAFGPIADTATARAGVGFWVAESRRRICRHEKGERAIRPVCRCAIMSTVSRPPPMSTRMRIHAELLDRAVVYELKGWGNRSRMASLSTLQIGHAA